jgi:ribonucleoside-diphosphate reductase subunit M2
MERIDKMRPMYHSGSSLEERFEPGPGSSHSSHMNGFEDKAGSSSKMAIRSSHPDTIDVGMDEVQGETIKSKRRFVEEEDEEILRESNDRFVLFPIKYHEVSAASPSSSTRRAARSFKVRECPLTVSDLEGVQSRTSRVLDCRGTRSRTRSP